MRYRFLPALIFISLGTQPAIANCGSEQKIVGKVIGFFSRDHQRECNDESVPQEQHDRNYMLEQSRDSTYRSSFVTSDLPNGSGELKEDPVTLKRTQASSTTDSPKPKIVSLPGYIVVE